MQRVTAPTRSTTASERVIEAVAARKGVDPMDLDVPLFQAVDPDVLDLLVRTADDGADRYSTRVEFVYDGFDVTVTADGSVDVLERR